MHGNEQLSSTHEMYLKVLYRLQQENDVGRVRDMAKGLGVTPSTVSAVLKKLELGGLVVHDRYGAIKLTPAGTRVAVCVVRRFEIIKAFLADMLGLDAEVAAIDACAMEHVVSPATVNRMELLVQRVARGDIEFPTISSAESLVSICADCEASRMCQAVATLETGGPSRDKN